jgi:AI-2 transport protein TqsA
MDAVPHRRATPSQIMVTLAAFVVVVAGMRASTTILVPFLMAAFIAIVGAAPMFWLKRKGIPTWLSLVIVIFGIVMIGLLVSALLSSSVNTFSGALPTYETKLKNLMDTIMQRMNALGIRTSGLEWSELVNPGSAMKLVASGLNSLRLLLTNGFLILMTVIFMLIEASSLPTKLRSIFGDAEDALTNFDRFIDTVKQYMAIKTLIGFSTGALVAIMLGVIGVDYPLLWGLLAFLLNYIPNIGSIIAAVPAVLLAVIQLGSVPAIAAAAGYFVINLVMGNVIEPRFMGRSLGLSTLVVFLSLLFWGWVLGPVGMLLSVPLTMTAKIALDTHEETRWLSILLGPEKNLKQPPKTAGDPKAASQTEKDHDIDKI